MASTAKDDAAAPGDGMEPHFFERRSLQCEERSGDERAADDDAGLNLGQQHADEEAAANAHEAKPIEGTVYDSLNFKMHCSPAARRELQQCPSGFAAAAWSEKRIPATVELSRAALQAVCRPYHTLLFDSSLKDLVRGGIPPSLRPTMWYWLSGGYALQLASPVDLFNKLSASLEGIENTVIDSIEDGTEGICQTYKSEAFRENLVLRTGKGLEALTHVMYAILQHLPTLTYSRGLHQLAAFLVVAFGAHRSEHAFWSLVGFVNKLFPYVKGEVSHGNFVEKGVLELLVQKKLPKLSEHISKMGWTLAVLTHGWYSTIFTSNLQPEVAARVWDAIMSEGSKVMHRVALALLKRYEPLLLAAHDVDAAKRVLVLQLSQITDKDKLMKEAFSSVGSLPSALLSQFRAQVLSGSAYKGFKVLQATNTDMHFESSPEFSHITVLQPAVGLKGVLGRSVARLSHNSDDGCGGSAFYKCTTTVSSEGGYGSDGEHTPFAPKRRRARAKSETDAPRHVHWDGPGPGGEEDEEAAAFWRRPSRAGEDDGAAATEPSPFGRVSCIDSLADEGAGAADQQPSSPTVIAAPMCKMDSADVGWAFARVSLPKQVAAGEGAEQARPP